MRCGIFGINRRKALPARPGNRPLPGLLLLAGVCVLFLTACGKQEGPKDVSRAETTAAQAESASAETTALQTEIAAQAETTDASPETQAELPVYSDAELAALTEEEALTFLRQLKVALPDEAETNWDWEGLAYQTFQEAAVSERGDLSGSFSFSGSLLVVTLKQDIWFRVRQYRGIDRTEEEIVENWDSLGPGRSVDEVLALLADKNVVLIRDGRLTSGEDLWTGFYELTRQGVPDSVLLVRVYTLTGQRMVPELFEEEYPLYPYCFLTRLDYDGSCYHCVTRQSSSAEIEPGDDVSYRYLKCLSGRMPEASAYDSYLHYVLVDDDSLTWEQLEHGLLSSQSGDYIPFAGLISEYYRDEDGEMPFAAAAYYPSETELAHWYSLEPYEHPGEYYVGANLDFPDWKTVFPGTGTAAQSLIGLRKEDAILWRAVLPYALEGRQLLSDGLLVYGVRYEGEDLRSAEAILEHYAHDGSLLWQHRFSDTLQTSRQLAGAEETADGLVCVFRTYDQTTGESWAEILRLDRDGKLLRESRTAIGSSLGLRAAAAAGEDVILALADGMTDEPQQLLRIRPDGSLAAAGSLPVPEGSAFTVTDLTVRDGKLYVSGYLSRKAKGQGGYRGEVEAVLETLFAETSGRDAAVSSDELTQMVCAGYEAVLLTAELPEETLPLARLYKTLCSRAGCLGGRLSPAEEGGICWDIEEPCGLFFSPATSSFTIGGKCRILCFEYQSELVQSLMLTDRTGTYRR